MEDFIFEGDISFQEDFDPDDAFYIPCDGFYTDDGYYVSDEEYFEEE